MKILYNQWFIGIVCSLIASFLWTTGNDLVNIELLHKFLLIKYEIFLWEIIMYAALLGLIVMAVRLIFKRKKKFLSYTTGNWARITWVWDWKLNESKKYEISNLNMICPKCNIGIFTVATIYSKTYDCVECGYSVPNQYFNKPSSDQIKDEINNEIRKRFPNELKYIVKE
jgi:ribosomal protein S27AE